MQNFLSTRVALFLVMIFTVTGNLRADNQYGLKDDIQDGVILHCFDWSLSDIKDALPDIAEAGFTAVQTSPLQRSVTTSEAWYDAYRPYDFTFIESSALGSEDDLKELCEEADNYGIKVIVDVVFNHVDGSSSSPTLYHDSWWNGGDYLRWYGDVDYSSRYSITHNQMGGASGYPDVNSENSDVQARALAYIEQLKEDGVDGIRFDAAKHIGLPSEGCDFWSTVTSVDGLWYYGEVLDGTGGTDSELLPEYQNYMSITDNTYGNNMAASFANGSVNSSIGVFNQEGASTDKLVYWGESHDTYCNDGGASKNMSQNVIDRAYAVVAGNNGASALYLSRPSSSVNSSIMLGVKGSTHFTSSEVAEVNHMHNICAGESNYYVHSGNVAAQVRNSGAIIVLGSGSNQSVSFANGDGSGDWLTAGTYTDKVSGNTFTVTASTISGTVGSTGIAVIYNETTSSSPSVTLSPDGGNFITDNLTVTATLSDATSGTYQIGDGESVSFTDSTTFTIGDDMSYGDSITVTWTAESEDGTTATGSATYTKVDPDAAITIYCNASSAPYLYAWSSESGSDVTLNGSWPGTQMTETTTVNGTAYYSKSFSGVSSLNIIFNNGSGSQTDDITGITASTYYTYDGSTTATVVTEIISDTTATDTTATDSTVTDSTTTDSTNIYIPTLESSSEISVFFETSQTTAPYVWVWGTDDVNYNDNGSWPGDEMTLMGTAANGNSIYKWTYTGSLTDLPTGIIFCKDASGTKFNSSDGTFVNHGYYTEDSPLTTSTVITAVESSEATYTPTLDSSDEISVFFETSQTTAPYVWVWGTDNVNYNENGSWPGDEMTLMGTAANGNSIYKWTYTGSLTDLPTGIIFCKDASGTKFNSSDGTFVNHGYYTEDSPLTTSTIITATSTDSAKYSTTTGLSVIETTTTDIDVWYTLQGQRISEPTGHGIFIHNGKKVMK
ncbi:MAG: starch-binding protein [Prevotella sp.]|jgi:hypothetical protein